ncbi:transcriptional regulator [Streptantibioticus ferralitis]|uniref:Transcriptional regulator n=1 Tax=Streptantibioticus ferralitis TaxID=236510 RepID=A0ABT5YS12_9ACTN|nr:transcriptional regulator [Streptantibioticus ferralitis]MDF2254376.1 transcriptional regulator [Streptantibioticus ferralitis]
MSETWSGTPAISGISKSQRRLAALLADVIPGAATIRVHFQNPSRTWPHPHAHDTAGGLVPPTRTQANTAARWNMRAHPNAAPWGEVHEFHRASARLASAALTVVDRRR